MLKFEKKCLFIEKLIKTTFLKYYGTLLYMYPTVNAFIDFFFLNVNGE